MSPVAPLLFNVLDVSALLVLAGVVLALWRRATDRGALAVQQFGADLLTPQDVKLEVTAPPDLDRVKLTTEQCHHLVLIFKEALRNIAVHAHCSTACLAVSIADQRLEIEIHDDGSSLIGKLLCKPATFRRSGGGLRDAQMRAVSMGGVLEITSALGWGTRLRLTIPLNA